MLTRKKNQKGFTLVELLIVVVILGILAAVAIPRFLTTRDEAQFRTCQANMSAINSAVEEYCFQESITPDTAVNLALVTTPERFPDGVPICPRTGAVAYTLGGGTAADLDFNRAVCTFHGTLSTPTPDGPAAP
jgi:prepilin-type N-terminal cleavage/methylation domain-containing protein